MNDEVSPTLLGLLLDLEKKGFGYMGEKVTRQARDRRSVERRKPKRGVNMRYDDSESDEKRGSKRHCRFKR